MTRSTSSPPKRSQPGSPLGVALWGVGRWGRAWVGALQRSGQVDLLWAVDPRGSDPTLASEVAWASHPGPSLDDPRVEAVVVATPVETHAELARHALAHGRHVFVEKPVTTSSSELEDLLRTADRAERVVLVNHLLLHHPAFARLERELGSGTIGELEAITARRVSVGDRRLECPWWTLAPHDLALIDRIGPELLGTDVLVTSRGSERRATLVDPAGRAAHLSVSLSGPRKVRLFVVHGSHGTLVFDDLQNHRLTLYERALPHVDPEPLDERRLRSRLGFGRPLELEQGTPLDRALAAFVRTVRTHRGTPPEAVAHMRRVVSALERGAATLQPDTAIEVPA